MPKPKKANTGPALAASIAKRKRAMYERKAEELRAVGYTVTAPEHPRIAEIEREVRENPGPIVRDERCPHGYIDPSWRAGCIHDG